MWIIVENIDKINMLFCKNIIVIVNGYCLSIHLHVFQPLYSGSTAQEKQTLKK